MSETEDTSNDTGISISTPLDGDVTFLISKFTAFEAISKPFIIDIVMHASLEDISMLEIAGKDVFESMVGGDCCISIEFYTNSEEQDAPKTRYFSGIVGEFKYAGERSVEGQIFAQYKMKLYPKFWSLKYIKDYHIFQSMSSTDIIESVFASDAQDIEKNSLIEDTDTSIEERDYAVQYGETTYDFISRLMEEDGIFYYFVHDEDSHEMQIANNNEGFTEIEGGDGIFQLAIAESGMRDRPYLNTLLKAEFIGRITPEKYVAVDFDFKQPSQSMEADTGSEDEERTVYEYPARYTSLSLGDAIAQRRLEGKQLTQFSFHGESTAPFFSAGYVFELAGPTEKEGWNEEWNQEYVINTVSHTFDFQGKFMIYKNKFTAFPNEVAFRPHRLTERPKVYGADTALVMGPEDSEIYTDEYARIKVKFHWDHDEDAEDDARTCWIRVAQSFAGDGFGTLFTPRVGQEVLITFINGNPDRPIVTGSLYNADNMPAYRSDDEDDHKPEVTSIRTKSTPDAQGYNELRFDDTAEEEDLYLHAQKDMHVEVCDTQDSKIGGDLSLLVKSNRYTEVRTGDDYLVITAGSRRVDILAQDPDDADFFGEEGDLDGDIEVTTAEDLESIESSFADDDVAAEVSDTLVIHSGDRRILLMEGNDKTVLSSGNQSIKLLAGSRTIEVEGDETHSISGDYTLNVDGDFTIVVGGDFNIQVAGDLSQEVSGDIDMTADGSISMTANEVINLTAGGAINITAGGLITVLTPMLFSVSAGLVTIVAITTVAVSAGLGISLISISSRVSLSSVAGGMVSLTTSGVISLAATTITNIASAAIISNGGALWSAKAKISSLKGSIMVSTQSSLIAVLKGLLAKIN